jgi:hypothetical protein
MGGLATSVRGYGTTSTHVSQKLKFVICSLFESLWPKVEKGAVMSFIKGLDSHSPLLPVQMIH